jgi:heme exporter protein D
MNGSGLAEFVEMGGYGLYVWGSYAMVLAAAVWERLLLAQRRRRALDDARAAEAWPEPTR